eukprot:204068-Rhodomonas_salina.2
MLVGGPICYALAWWYTVLLVGTGVVYGATVTSGKWYPELLVGQGQATTTTSGTNGTRSAKSNTIPGQYVPQRCFIVFDPGECFLYQRRCSK